MSDLLAADFARLLKSQVFHGMLIFCVECLTAEVVIGYMNKNLNIFYMQGLMKTNFIIFGILLSIFIGLFIGSEYSDGTIRNKIVAGNSRTAIYVSNFIISVIAGFIMQIIFFLIPNILIPIIFSDESGGNTFLFDLIFNLVNQSQVIGLYIIIVYTAVFLFMAMIICSRSGATAAAMTTAVVIFAVGMVVHGALESYDPQAAAAMEENESVVQYQSNYYGFGQRKPLKGFKLKMYLFLDDFLPSAQAQAITGRIDENKAPKYVIYDVSVTAVTTGLGILLYNKKDLK